MHTQPLKIRNIMMASLMACLLVLGGCATTGSSLLGKDSVQADPRLSQGNDAKFFSKSGYQACAVGAATAALGCLVSNSSNKAVCAIAAGIATCGVAMGANYYLDYRRSEYANTSERLNIMTADVEKDTANVVARTDTAMAVIRDDKEKISRIKREMATKQIDQEKAKKEIAVIDKNLEVMSRDVDNMNTKITQYKDVAKSEHEAGNSKEVKKLDREILKMSKKVALLESEVDELYTQRSAITLG